ncbi:cation diffusion facilitator family transporter [Nitrospira defluvii]|uniref:Metal cation efflux system protein CzcD n=1 Tax=Nitrospira defluvii TaxID=330214 RepID=A0ABN7LVY8_9BACT|nr:cation diffusion facilitator family transporter [Nitrospira defluvii]CAE6771244.1 Metal cation efflux system protein CzcD [Nitrospira defluvii]
MHSNLESRSVQQKNLRRVLLLTGVFMVVEVIAGLFTGSLALLADAGHMLTDVAALSLSAFALWMAGKPSTPENTYGYHRAEILAAVVNAVVLLLLATWILYEAYDRFGEPSQVLGLPMLLVGLVGLAVNLASLKLLDGHADESVNVRSAYLEVMSDAISSLGVMLGGAIIWTTGWVLIDPLLSVGISLFIAWRTWALLSQAVHVLMEGVPTGVDAREVGRAMAGVPGVKGVHDLHIWTITTGLDALSSHVVVSVREDQDAVLQRLQQLLAEQFGIEHVTLQIVEQGSDRIRIDSQSSRNVIE